MSETIKNIETEETKQEVAEVEETKKEGIFTKVKNGVAKHGKTVAKVAGVAVVGVVAFALGKGIGHGGSSDCETDSDAIDVEFSEVEETE